MVKLPKLANLFLVLLITGCSSNGTSRFSSTEQEITGRDRIPLYRVATPAEWDRQDTEGALEDTTKPLCTFVHNQIHITLHNFINDPPVPPEAQIARWERQMHPPFSTITPQAFGGYVGKLYEAENSEQAVMAWALHLAPELFPLCSGEKRADVTIKVVGPKEALAQNREEILAFARSFQLIDALSLDE